MPSPSPARYVSRGGEKLAAALEHFGVDVAGLACADFGSHVGGFVDCLLQRNAARVYSVDTAYGILAWKLRRDPRVVVIERTNAMHVELPERVAFITIDVGWTKQVHILPAAARVLAPAGRVVSLIKPHYEAPPAQLVGGVLADEALPSVVDEVVRQMTSAGWTVEGTVQSPLEGHGGNREVLALLTRAC